MISWILVFILWYFWQSLVYWGSFLKLGLNIEKKTFYFVFQEKYLGHHLSYPHYTPMNAVWVYQHIEQFNKFNKFILKAIKLINHTRFFCKYAKIGILYPLHVQLKL